MNRKMAQTLTFLLSLLPMLLNQYGGARGVQEIRGIINLINPIGMISVLLFILGVWFPFKEKPVNTVFGALGAVGIVISEIYKFFTWHTMTITGDVNLMHSIRFAFPEFYLGLAVSIAMVAIYFVIDKKVSN